MKDPMLDSWTTLQNQDYMCVEQSYTDLNVDNCSGTHISKNTDWKNVGNMLYMHYLLTDCS